MKILITYSRVFCLFLLLIGHAHAQDDGWGGEGEVGFASTSGNTDTTTLNIGLTGKYASETWSHEVNLTAFQTSDNDQTSAERYEFKGQSNFALSE